MKKLLMLIAFGFFLTACSNKATEVAPVTGDSTVVTVDTVAPVAADTVKVDTTAKK